MSPSSSGSWEGAAGNIIDLDRYMRGHVRPSSARTEDRPLCEQLVVDGGGVGRKPTDGAGSARFKNYSHDSGVSDGSYERRAHRPRRASNTDGRARPPRDKTSARTFNGVDHTDSLRAFRTVCEQALLDQQRQIARVAQLCELLTERADEKARERTDRPERIDRLAERTDRPLERINDRPFERTDRVPERTDRPLERTIDRSFERINDRQFERTDRLPERTERQLERTTDRLSERTNERLSERQFEKNSDRLSGRDSGRVERSEKSPERPPRPPRPPEKKAASDRPRRDEGLVSDTSDISSSSRSTKDLRRKENYRTQECKTYKIIMTKLDELNRRFSPSPPRARPRAPPRPRSLSSTSVSVCDKLVATDPERTFKVIRPFQKLQSRGPASASAASSARPRVVTQAYSVDIAPNDLGRTPNVATESVVKCDSSCSTGTSAPGDQPCHFDLEDPVHLYTQAKRLQALTATTRRAHTRPPRPAPPAAPAAPAAPAPRPPLCALCRAYWRALKQCLAATFTQTCKCA